MDEDKLKKIIGNSVKREETQWVKTIQNQTKQMLTNKIKTTEISKQSQKIKNVKKVNGHKGHELIYFLIVCFILGGIFYLWKILTILL